MKYIFIFNLAVFNLKHTKIKIKIVCWHVCLRVGGGWGGGRGGGGGNLRIYHEAKGVPAWKGLGTTGYYTQTVLHLTSHFLSLWDQTMFGQVQISVK